MNKTNRSEFTLSASWRWYAIACALGASFIFIQTPLNALYNAFSGETYNVSYEFSNWDSFSDLNILSTLILIPITEELFFRQFIQRKLQKKMHVVIAIFVAAVLFGFIHLSLGHHLLGLGPVRIRHMYITFFGGLLLGFIYFKSRSIGPTVVCHIAWNTMAVLT
ncbi:MAG: CPBP family intramembrane metalloprotease [bacterium]|nr:CPBP family intramembrane metalloprotease [bacterium]